MTAIVSLHSLDNEHTGGFEFEHTSGLDIELI
jgi:hypothetical protein